jgi:hypothetical protein
LFDPKHLFFLLVFFLQWYFENSSNNVRGQFEYFCSKIKNEIMSFSIMTYHLIATAQDMINSYLPVFLTNVVNAVPLFEY